MTSKEAFESLANQCELDCEIDFENGLMNKYNFDNAFRDVQEKITAVKKDLEVLEILKKKQVNVHFFIVSLENVDPLKCYNGIMKFGQLSEDEYKKIEEWLNDK